MHNTKEDKYSLKELRQFGVGLGLLLSVVGAVMLWRHRPWAWVPLAASPLVIVAFRYGWPGTAAFFTGWMVVAKKISQLILTSLLVLFFFLVLTPIALLARLFGQSFVERRFREQRQSYWHSYAHPTNRSTCEKQS